MGMNTIKARNDSNLTKIDLNDMGDYVVISTDDETFFEQFDSGYKSIVRQAEDLEAKAAELDKKYEGKEDFWSRSEYATEKIREKKNFQKRLPVSRIVFSGKVQRGNFSAMFMKRYRILFRALIALSPSSSR